MAVRECSCGRGSDLEVTKGIPCLFSLRVSQPVYFRAMKHVGHSWNFREDSNAKKNREMDIETPLSSSPVWTGHVRMLELAT